MKIIISRTSDMYGREKPCEEARMGMFPYWSSRACSEEYFDENFSNSEGLWRSKGKNHTTVGSHITRQEDDRELWYVDIESFDDLYKLQDKEGELIIKTYKYGGPNDKLLEIEIYDTYRE